jgi:hypothetical protein
MGREELGSGLRSPTRQMSELWGIKAIWARQRAADELLRKLPVEGRQMLGGSCAQPHRATPMSTVNFELLRLGTSSRRAHGDDVAGRPG